MSCSSSRIWPSSGSYSRATSFRIVLFPDPFAPTMTCEHCQSRPQLMARETHAKLSSRELERDVLQSVLLRSRVPEGHVPAAAR